jgi:hypothetical protein
MSYVGAILYSRPPHGGYSLFTAVNYKGEGEVAPVLKLVPGTLFPWG